MRVLPWCLPVFVFAGSIAFAQSPPIPDQQQKFISIINNFAAKYKSAPNAMKQSAVRPQRKQALCQLLPDAQVTDWVGTVRDIDANMGGKGILKVSIGKNTHAKTWNNALSDSGDKTLIALGSPLHDAASELSPGQVIFFSGTFIKDAQDCFREASLTWRNSMSNPDWIFRFSSVRPAK